MWGRCRVKVECAPLSNAGTLSRAAQCVRCGSGRTSECGLQASEELKEAKGDCTDFWRARVAFHSVSHALRSSIADGFLPFFC